MAAPPAQAPVGAAAKFTCGDVPATIVATAGMRTIGTPGRDVILGTLGNDIIDGRGGDDIICGDSGNDIIRGQSGNDSIYGGYGNDIILGGIGDDDLHGGLPFTNNLPTLDTGDDTINGGPGDDHLWGGFGDDHLIGEAGQDNFTGDSTYFGLGIPRGNDVIDMATKDDAEDENASGDLGNDYFIADDGFRDIIRPTQMTGDTASNDDINVCVVDVQLNPHEILDKIYEWPSGGSACHVQFPTLNP